VSRDEPGRFDDLLSFADAERLVCDPGLRHPAFRLVSADRQLALGDYALDIPWRPTSFTGTADVRSVVAEFDRGATIVLQGLHLNRIPTARYCRALEEALGHPAQANAYLTPRHSQGLPVHHDTHEVFVLQVSGSKRWQVWEPVLELPLKHQHYSADLGESQELVLDIELRPGDTLYLPRGWLHRALTSDEDSLHLTIGVNVVTWLDALRAALRRAEEDVEVRRSVPADGEGAAEVLERLAAHLRPEEVARSVRQTRVRRRRPVLDGQLTELRALDDLTLDTPLVRRETVLLDVVDGDDGSFGLRFEGRTVWFPPHAREEAEAVAWEDGAFRPADLPGRLDEAGRLVLVRRLVREGLLRRAAL
jgi:JmjC domain